MGSSTWTHLARWAAVVVAASAAIVVCGGTAVWSFERRSADSNLLHWGDALWWSMTTLTTVGYGEHFPVTLGGRLVAVGIMVSGITIIGAVAAIVALSFAGRLAQRLEEAVSQVESQVETVEAEVEHVEDELSGSTGMRRFMRRPPSGSLREVTVEVSDADCVASLTWLLARLGWHPDADVSGLRWRQGGVQIQLTVRSFDLTPGVPGRLTFTAGTPERACRIARESLRHGFVRLTDAEAMPAHLRAASGFDITLIAS